MTTIVKAILAINPVAQISMQDDDIDNITWLNGTTPIAKADILTKQNELQATHTNNAYQRNRDKEYPKLKEQLDLLYHDMNSDKGDKTGEWFKAIKTVKDKYAKG